MNFLSEKHPDLQECLGKDASTKMPYLTARSSSVRYLSESYPR